MKKYNYYNIDEIILTLISGNGGNGCVSFLKNRYTRKGYPDGGKGGNGGNIYIIKDKKVNNFNHIKHIKKIKAENGYNGKKKNCSGKKGKDYILRVPIKTKIKILKKNLNLNYKKKRFLFFIKGGKGGFGNNKFKSSINRSPTQYQIGSKGTKIKLKLIYNLKVDICIIGLPNSGKSSITKYISNINPKIASYPFTTIKSNIGLLKNNKKNIFIIDTPGISKKKPLKNIDLNFFKYINKCKIILHIIEIKKKKEKIIKNIKIILQNILQYKKKLIKKQWFIFNKYDLFSSYKIKKILNVF